VSLATARDTEGRRRVEGQGSRTPLSWAAEDGHEAVVKLLLAIEKVEFTSRTVMVGRRTWLLGRGTRLTVQLLLEKGADVESKDNYDRTPLSWAAGTGTRLSSAGCSQRTD